MNIGLTGQERWLGEESSGHPRCINQYSLGEATWQVGVIWQEYLLQDLLWKIPWKNDCLAWSQLEFIQALLASLGLNVKNLSKVELREDSSSPVVLAGSYFIKFACNSRALADLERELNYYQALEHSGLCVRLEAFYAIDGWGCLVLENWPGMSLWDQMNQNSGRWQEYWQMAIDKMRYLVLKMEENQLAGHGDMHLGQILCSTKGASADTNPCRIIDFGGEPLRLEEDDSLNDPIAYDWACLWRSLGYWFYQSDQKEKLPDKHMWRALWQEFLEYSQINSEQLDKLVEQRNRYEMEYEKRYRPEWLAVAQAGQKIRKYLFG